MWSTIAAWIGLRWLLPVRTAVAAVGGIWGTARQARRGREAATEDLRKSLAAAQENLRLNITAEDERVRIVEESRS